METSPSIKEIAAALHKFHDVKVCVVKDSVNPAFKSKYASLASILESIREPLYSTGLAVIQFPDGAGLTTRLQHTSGEFMQATAPVTPIQNTPQAQGSAITYARRYALCAMLALIVDDDDGQAASAAPAVKLATDAQKNELRELLAHESVSDEGRALHLASLHAIAGSYAEKVLAGLKRHICQHETAEIGA